METAAILIVEDDPIIAADLQDRLTESGYAVLGPVAAGEETLSFFHGGNLPDLVLMDIQLEGEWDGIETARRIREQHDVPLIFLTSNSDDKTFREAREAGPQAFLSKPFRGRDLRHAIELAIQQAARKENPVKKKAAEEENAYLMKDRLFIKAKGCMVRLFFKDILWVAADDYYCRVFTKEKEYLITQTLKKFGEELSGVPEIMRVHRSYLVNLAHVEAIGDLYLHIGKQRIPFSRSAKEELLARLKKI
ncbi:MAG: response regulator [Phaeodactylibacter sp.]|nr:response regulator [Phaeodactylibacter sp.]